MIFISDIHHGIEHLKSLPSNKGPVVILGDLINWIDYRNGDGIAKDVFGIENVELLIRYRKEHKFDERKNLWKKLYLDNPDEIASKMSKSINKQYEDVFDALLKNEVWIIPGNVDDVEIINSHLSKSVINVDGELVSYKNITFGFSGGGVPTPINARGEITEENFFKKLETLSGCDIICTHAPPKVPSLITDVITNKEEQGWDSLLSFIQKYQPKYSLFGDVHQPVASKWVIGKTICRNIGYFRATSQYLELSSLII